MAPSIIILSGNHLCHNPRVLKEATALSRAGCDVEVLGAWSDLSLREQDLALLPRLTFRFRPVVDLTRGQLAGAALGGRIRRKAGHLAHRFAGIQSRWQLGYAVEDLHRAAKATSADLYIAHSEQALAVADALRLSGRTVAVDMEDWYSEDLLPEAREHRPTRLLRTLERELLRRSVSTTCPSRRMSEALAAEFGCAAPAVVYNAFPWADRESIDGLRKDTDGAARSIHWHSQTIGPGRGLEDLLAALPLLDDRVQLCLRGSPVQGFQAWLAARVAPGLRNRVALRDLVPHHELLSRIAEHDIGFAGEMKYCRSRDLTVTNKILHYLLAGLAVVASDTRGQREVAERAPGGVLLYRAGDAKDLAAKVNSLLAGPDVLQAARACALRAARETFCWERQEAELLRCVMSATEASP